MYSLNCEYDTSTEIYYRSLKIDTERHSYSKFQLKVWIKFEIRNFDLGGRFEPPFSTVYFASIVWQSSSYDLINIFLVSVKAPMFNFEYLMHDFTFFNDLPSQDTCYQLS